MTDFFRINLPYGMRKVEDKWYFFNREYMPIGWNSKKINTEFNNDIPFENLPIHTKYKGMTDEKLLSIFNDKDLISFNKDGTISMCFLYKDRTNPLGNSIYWEDYFNKIKELSKFLV
jgi:hypothetical protein